MTWGYTASGPWGSSYLSWTKGKFIQLLYLNLSWENNLGVGNSCLLNATTYVSIWHILFHLILMLKAPYQNGADSPVVQWLRIHLQCNRHSFNPQIRRIPWRRAQQPTPVFLPGESQRQRSLLGYRSWGKESDTTEVTACTYPSRIQFLNIVWFSDSYL